MLDVALLWENSLLAIGLAIFIACSFVVVQFLLDYHEKLSICWDVGCHKTQWLLGHINIFGPCQKDMFYMARIVSKYPKCMLMWFSSAVVYLDCHHPEMIKPVLSTEEPKDDMAYRFLRPWIGEGLLTAHGNKWKRNRRLLTPVFHFDILRHYLVVFNRTANTLMEKWSKREDGHFSVDMFPDLSRMSLDTILQCIMSKKSNCQHDVKNEYLSAVGILTEVAMQRIFFPPYHFDWIFALSPMGKKYKKALEIAHNYTRAEIMKRHALIAKTGLNLEEYIKWKTEQKSQGHDVSLDFLDILLLAKDDQGVGLTAAEIRQELDTFVFEGHDTVSSGISWALYNLATNPKHQELCREEVANVIGGRKHVEWDDLSKLPYLTMCIKESLRLCPSVFTVARKTTKPLFFPRGFGADQYNLSDTPCSESSRTMPKKFNFGINIFLLHRNSNVWKDPHKFDPERFSPENLAKRSPHAYLPFSAGPRNCIGQHFAMNEMKVVIALALSRFRFTPDESYPEPELEPYVILRSKTGIHLKLERL